MNQNIETGAGQSYVDEETAVPMVMVACAVCAYVRFFAWNMVQHLVAAAAAFEARGMKG